MGTTDLSHIEDLKTMALGLRADVHISIDDLHVPPHNWHGLRGQSAFVFQAAVLLNFDERGSIVLTDGTEFTTIWGSPAYNTGQRCFLFRNGRPSKTLVHTPNIISFFFRATHFLVTQETMHIHIVASIFTRAALVTFVPFVVATVFAGIKQTLFPEKLTLLHLYRHQTVHGSHISSAGQASNCQQGKG